MFKRLTLHIEFVFKLVSVTARNSGLLSRG